MDSLQIPQPSMTESILQLKTRMDHKRGHGSLDHANEQSTRVKRHKDYSYQQPPTNSSQGPAPLNTRSSRLQSEEGREARSASVQTRSSRVELASVEQLRSIAEKSAKSVNNLGRSSPPENAQKTAVEDNAYEELLPILLSELAVEKSACRSNWPLVLTDRRVGKHCHICPSDRPFRGWEALLIHAAKFQKEKTREHRGYYRAIRDALLQSTDDKIPVPDIRQGPTSPLRRACKRSGSGRWAPSVILVDDKDDEAEGEEEQEEIPREKKGKDRPCRAKGLRIRPSRDPQLEEVLAVYSTGRQHQRKKVLAIPAAQVGFIETGLMKKASSNKRATESPEHDEISNIMEGRWPGAKIKKYVGGDGGSSHDAASSTSTALCTTNGNRTMQLGRPTSPKDRSQRLLVDIEQEKLESGELRLWKPLDEHRHVFDEEQFDDKVQTLISKWRGGFKDSTIGRDDDLALEVGGERNLLQARKMPKRELEKRKRFNDEVEKYAFLNPSGRKQVSRQMTVLEDELRKDKLVWLQEVEAVREQFQALADSVHDEQVERDGATMRIEKHLDTRTKTMKERMYDKKNFFMTRKIQCMQNVRRMRREQDVRGLMELWSEEQRTFEKECQCAKKEKEKLIGLHEKIHAKAKESKRKQCPICLEKWDVSKDRWSYMDASRLCK